MIRPLLRPLFALTLTALAAQAAAQTYWMVAPNPIARWQATTPAGAPEQSHTLALSSFVPTPGAEGTPYQLDLRGLTQLSSGSVDAVSYSLVGGVLPTGLSLSVGGLISGTPTGATPAEGRLVTVQASYGGKTAQQSYLFTMGAMSITLTAATLPEAKVGEPYAFDFKSLTQVKGGSGIANATFKHQGSTLPKGLNLGSDGVLSGKPEPGSTTAGSSFTVVGTYLTKTGQRAYTIVVQGVPLQVVQIDAGDVHTCAVTTAGAARCWGGNGDGQLGDGTKVQRNTPVPVVGLESGVASVVTGTKHTCAVTTAGAVMCWGDGSYGQLGNGGTASSTTPVQVTGLTSGVNSIATRGGHTCAVTTAGAAKCWGYNFYGQLGNGGTASSTTPVQVTNLTSGVSGIAVGTDHTCAVTTAGGVRCWGNNSRGQLGDRTNTERRTPVPVYKLDSGVVSLAASGDHACVVTSAGAAWCWGEGDRGQLGNGNAYKSSEPVPVSGLNTGVASLDLGSTRTCAMTTAGAVKCWGNYVRTPEDVIGLQGPVAGIAAAGLHTCAWTAVGSAQCWGYNSSGQLGDGTTEARSAPVNVRE